MAAMDKFNTTGGFQGSLPWGRTMQKPGAPTVDASVHLSRPGRHPLLLCLSSSSALSSSSPPIPCFAFQKLLPDTIPGSEQGGGAVERRPSCLKATLADLYLSELGEASVPALHDYYIIDASSRPLHLMWAEQGTKEDTGSAMSHCQLAGQCSARTVSRKGF